jgi:hypothetical protein
VFLVLQCMFLIFHDIQFSRRNPGPTVCFSNYSSFSVFLTISQVLQCVFVIFHDIQFSLHTLYPRVCNFHFQPFSVLSIYSRSYSVCVSSSTYFSFLAIIQVLQCVFLFFQFYSVSRHILCPTVYVSYFP